MPLIYTTTDAIARRLRGRLKVSNTLSPNVAPSVNTQQVVDPELIEDIGSQVEDKINMILGQIYEMPLVNEHKILAGIVAKLVIADLMATHFQSSQIPELGGDAGFGSSLRKTAMDDLALITAGHNINFAGLPMQPNIPGISTPQPLVLPGERLKTNPPDTLTRNVTIVSQTRGRELTDAAKREWGITWGDGYRARSAEDLW